MSTLNITPPAPPILTGFTVAGGINSALLKWNATPFSTDRYEVWQNTVNNVNTATLAALVETNSYSPVSLVTDDSYYFWVRTINGFGVAGSFTTGLTFTPDKIDGKTSIEYSSIFTGQIAPGAVSHIQLLNNRFAAESIDLGSSIESYTSSFVSIAPDGVAGPFYCLAKWTCYMNRANSNYFAGSGYYSIDFHLQEYDELTSDWVDVANISGSQSLDNAVIETSGGYFSSTNTFYTADATYLISPGKTYRTKCTLYNYSKAANLYMGTQTLAALGHESTIHYFLR